MHIPDGDCVVLKVKYHKRCYERYTSCVRHVSAQDEKRNKKEVNNYKYRKSFVSFCVFIQHELIENENIYYMARLRKEFVMMVQKIDNEDASNFKTCCLKKGWKRDFPSLYSTNQIKDLHEKLYMQKSQITMLLPKGRWMVSIKAIWTRRMMRKKAFYTTQRNRK